MESSSNGDCGPWRQYREHTTLGCSYSSSSGYTSGTIVSTAYTSNSSHLSSFSMEAAATRLDMVELEEHEDRPPWTETEKKDTEFVPPIKKPRKETEETDTEFGPPIKKHRKEAEKTDSEFDPPIKKPHKETEMKHAGVVCNHVMHPPPYKKLRILLDKYKALSDLRHVGRQGLQECSKLSAAQENTGDAIWSTMERIRTHIWESIDREYGDDTSSSRIPQVSSDIHEATKSAMEYIRFLCNSSFMGPIVSKALQLGKYVPQLRNMTPQEPMDNMIMDTTSCLQEKLVKMSESFPDQGLRFLFLLNNFEFIQQSLLKIDIFLNNFDCMTHEEAKDLSKKVEGYIEKYLQACWEPVLLCLFSPTPLCFRINHSPLLKFESEFNKAYATQKLWKVLCPNLRERLRTAITKKIVPRYTEYIEENNITTPRVAPQDLEKMLQELFEG